MTQSNSPFPISPHLLEILRCPVAIRNKTSSEDPGRLRLMGEYWLICDDSGMKYPIVNGIPIMLIDEGQKWKDVAEGDLPVPPPNP